MKTKIFPTLLTIFFMIIFFIFYKGLQNSNIYTPNNNIEQDIPSFEAEELDSNSKLSSDEIFLEDKFYLLNIWASWCVPCREEHGFLINLFKQKDIEIIGLNYKDDNKKAKIFLKELKSPYKLILLDPDGTISIEWGAYGVPETFLIYDRKIIKKIIGPINNDSLIEIKRLIK